MTAVRWRLPSTIASVTLAAGRPARQKRARLNLNRAGGSPSTIGRRIRWTREMEFTRRRAKDSDRSFVQDVMRRAYEDVVVSQFGQWDEDVQSDRFNKEWDDTDFEIVEGRAGPLGAIWTSNEGDHLWLREVFLLPTYQGQGIGSRLVRQELARARRLNMPLRLRVLRQNRARVLYERLGLSVCGETDTHYWMEAV